MLRPKTWWQKITAGEFVYEVLIAMFAAGVGVVNGWIRLKATPPDYEVGWAFVGLAVAVTAVMVLRAYRRNRLAQGGSAVSSLDAAIETLHAILINDHPYHENHKLRICVFVPSNKPNSVHQITDYVGTESRYGGGRDLSSRCGVVGRAFRSGEVQYDKLPDSTALIDHLVSIHGFDRTEASNMRADRKSWAAIPVGEAGQVVAVVFLDSAVAKFFGTGNHSRRKALQAATLAVAKTISRA